jgi:hypothetical protein
MPNHLVRAGATAVLLLGLAACDPMLPPAPVVEPEPDPQPPVVAYDTAYTIFWSALTSRFSDSTRIVVRDSASFAELLKQYDYAEIPERWRTDFSRYAVIVAALGARPMGGYGICIDSVRVRGDQATAYLTKLPESIGGVMIPTQPVHIVRTPVRNEPLIFVEEKSNRRCDPSWTTQP